MKKSDIFAEVEGTRERILRAALSVLQERGYEGLSMAAIAEEAGIEKPSIYHHYSNKDELLFSFLQFMIDHVAEQVATPADHNPLEQLRAAMDRVVLPNSQTGDADNCGPSELIVATYIQTRAQAVHRPKYLEQMTELDTAIRTELIAIIREAKAQGYMYEVDPGELAEALLTFGMGALQRQVTAEDVIYDHVRTKIHYYIDQFVLPEYRRTQPAEGSG
jgi:AcrR family transcriptional regulator